MKYKYVRTCECCGDNFSEVINFPIAAEYKHDAISECLKIKRKHAMSGKLSLLNINGMIVGFSYNYANKFELKKSTEFCDDLRKVARRYYHEWLNTNSDEIDYMNIDGESKSDNKLAA